MIYCSSKILNLVLADTRDLPFCKIIRSSGYEGTSNILVNERPFHKTGF